MLAKFSIPGEAKLYHLYHNNLINASGEISDNLVVDVVGNGPEWSWRHQRRIESSIESESLVVWIIRVLEVLNLHSFLYLCIFFILCRLMPLVNPLPFCHSVSTSCSPSYKWTYDQA